MSDLVCTVNEAFLGIPLGDCGKPAVYAAVATCGEGHVERSPWCENHRRLFVEEGWDMSCARCHEMGVRNRADMTVVTS